MAPLTVTLENAPKVWEWLNRGGIAVWSSADLSDPGWSVTTPRFNQDGTVVTKPHQKAHDVPRYISLADNQVVVAQPRELKRFHVAVRRDPQGLSWNLADASIRRGRREIAKALERYADAWHEIDYDNQDCVIIVSDTLTPIDQWAKEHGYGVDGDRPAE
jgi:hypothetical protein